MVTFHPPEFTLAPVGIKDGCSSLILLSWRGQPAPPAGDGGHADVSTQSEPPAGTFSSGSDGVERGPPSWSVCMRSVAPEAGELGPAGGSRRSTVTVQRPPEPSFSQQFVRPQQLLEGKVTPVLTKTGRGGGQSGQVTCGRVFCRTRTPSASG